MSFSSYRPLRRRTVLSPVINLITSLFWLLLMVVFLIFWWGCIATLALWLGRRRIMLGVLWFSLLGGLWVLIIGVCYMIVSFTAGWRIAVTGAFIALGSTAILWIWLECATREANRPMKRVCGWCKKVEADGTEPPTTGICPDCLKKHFPECQGAWDIQDSQPSSKGGAQ